VPPTSTPRVRRPEPLAAKVPAITALFWVVKVLTTGMGEAASDWLGEMSIALAAAVGVLGVAGALVLQFRTRRYVPGVYWSAVAVVAVFGTMAADALHVALDVPYAVSTAVYALALAVVFVLWRRSEGTLSIHSIRTRRRETWYWLTVLLTFALGTAAGDLTADELHLGYLPSVALFAVAMVVPALGWARFRLDPIAAFWTAYVLTRPLGASVADWLGKPHSPDGGVGVGDGVVTGVSAALIVVLVVVLTRTGHGVQEPSDDVRPAWQPTR